MAHQIVGQRALLRDIAHEHGDRAAHGLVNINDEDFVVVPEENSAPSAGRQNCADLHLDDRLIHPRKPYQPGCERQGGEDPSTALLVVIVLVLLLVLGSFFVFDYEHEHEHDKRLEECALACPQR